MSNYPLAELLEFRQTNVRQLEERLASELIALQAAEQRIAACQAERATLDATVAVEQREQHARVVGGHVIAHEFVQAAAHLSQRSREREQLSQTTVQALAELERCAAVTRATEALLARARRQLAAVQRHHLRYVKREQKLQEARMEEDAAEAWQILRTTHKREGGV